MIHGFAGRGTEDIFNRRGSRQARRTCPQPVWDVARRKLDMLNAAVSLASLRLPSGNALEPLKGDRQGQHSVRINEQYRLCFVWTANGPTDVEIVDYH